MAFVFLAALCGAGAVFADDDTDLLEPTYPDVVEGASWGDEGAGSGFGGGGPDAPGDNTTTTHVVPCWISNKVGPSTYREIAIGTLVAGLTTLGAFAEGDSYFNNPGDCDWGNDAGDVTAGTIFFARLGSWSAIDANVNLGATVTFVLDGDLWTDCTSGMRITDLDALTWSVTLGGTQREWFQPYFWDTTAPGAGSTGKGYRLTAPSSPDINALRYVITVTSVPTTGSTAMATTDGCFEYQGI